MKVADISIGEFKTLIKEAIREEIDEVLEIKRKIFELETLQALKEAKDGKVKAYHTVEEMMSDMGKNEI